MAEQSVSGLDPMDDASDNPGAAASRKRRNLPGTPDPQAEVVALSPRTLMATNRFVCEVCGKGFQRDQNLQLHRRGHNLPWKLKQREEQEIKKRVYVCPEVSCVHHEPSRALGDLTGIKKHFFRKHGDKKWKCEKCSKRYAVQSDWKAHQKVCGTREYRCDCGTLFSRRDSFITHRAFCEALAEESAKLSVCNPDETSQQCSDMDGNGASVRVSNALEASSSPFSQLTSGGLDTETSPREASGLVSGLEEGGVDSAMLNYGIERNSHSSNKGPALSLSLGTGPGPGLPRVSQMMECLLHNDNVLPVGVLGEHRISWPSMFGSMPDLPKGNMDTWKEYSSINNSSETWHLHALSEQDSNSNTSKSMNVHSSFKNSALSQFAPPSSGNISSFFGNEYFPSRHSSCHQRNPGSGQLPATALLQKAAMMGATSSIPVSLFHSFGGDSRVLTLKEGHKESYLGGGGSSLSSSCNPLLSHGKQSIGCYSTDGNYNREQETEGSIYPGLYGGHGSMQELLNSFCGRGAALLQSKPVDGHLAMSNARGSVQGNGRHHYTMGTSNIFLGGSMHQDSSTLAGLSGVENNEGSATTLDFLGIGGPGETVGTSSAGLARTLSQREIASITTLSAGIERDPVTARKGIIPARVEGGPSFWSQGSI